MIHTVNPEKIIIKLKKIAKNSLKDCKDEKALQAVSACSDLLYRYNQNYKDDDLEGILLQLASRLVSFDSIDNERINEKRKTVLFYDGFGLDRRGIAIVVCNAIVKNGYRLVYVSPEITKNKQPSLRHVLQNSDVIWRYVDNQNLFLKQISDLRDIIVSERPDVSFFYSKPYDSAGVVVFNALYNYTYRIQLDLTDHAFWLGINAFDICCGGRQYSASIEHYYRGIPLEKMCLLDANLFVEDNELGPLPFDPSSRFVFSGGQLYKTLGDKNLFFYRIAEHILENHDDVSFVYAGEGDKAEMEKLIAKYPDRVFLLSERSDFYRIIEKCTLYLNTYPMFGGLMMRYAALAGKIPITLKHGNDSDGILIDQPKREIEYDDYDELIEDVDRLLDDRDYLCHRESLLQGSVVTEEVYIRNIRLMIEEHRTEFTYSSIELIDTSLFREEYRKRFNKSELLYAIANKRQTKLALYFPFKFLMAALLKLKSGILRRR